MPSGLLSRKTGDVAFWGAALGASLLLMFVIFPTNQFGGDFVQFALFVAMNLMWMLVIGTAGIFSFATVAIVGGAAYVVTYLAGGSRAGYDIEGARSLNVILMLAIGVGVGALLGVIVALPGIRLRGVYFALFTFGLVELGRAIVVQQNTLGQNEGLYGATRFISPDDIGTDRARTVNFLVALAMIAFCLLVYRLVDGGRLGLLLRAARESEPVARATGVDINRARFAVFIISSAVLGMVGGFYSAFYGGVSPDIFSFDTLLLLLAMMVVGGLGSAKGTLVGTVFLFWIDRSLDDAEQPLWRFIIIGCFMLAVVLFARRGMAGIPGEIIAWAKQRRKGSDQPGAPAEPLAGATKAR